MKRRGFLAWMVSLALIASAVAQQNILGSGVFGDVKVASAPTYHGPGDLTPNATAWYGDRGYSLAWASGASCTGTISTTTLSVSACSSGTLQVGFQISGAGINKPAYITAIGTCASPPGTCTLNASQTVSSSETITANGLWANYRRASDNATQNGIILSTGAADIATANTFAGTDATCTGTISSTTLTCASGTYSAGGAPHAGSTLTGTGIMQPSYIVSCGTFTGGAGTCTLNAAQTVSVGETITMQYGLYVTEWYDQTGNGNNQTQSTAGNQPYLIPSCNNGLPCLYYNYPSLGTNTNNGSISIAGEPWTYASVHYSFSYASQVRFLSGGTANRTLIIEGSANAWAVSNSYSYNFSMSDLAWHSMQGSFDGASSLAYVDGLNAFTTFSGGSGVALSGFSIGYGPGVGNGWAGYISEVGIWPKLFSSTDAINLCHNDYLYWGTSVSC
jgi:hypothetical protein